MIVRAGDFALVLFCGEKDLVRGFSSRAMRQVRVTTRTYVTLPESLNLSCASGSPGSKCRKAAFFCVCTKIPSESGRTRTTRNKADFEAVCRHPVAEPTRMHSLFRHFNTQRELAAPASYISGLRAFDKKPQERIESTNFNKQLEIDALFLPPVVSS